MMDGASLSHINPALLLRAMSCVIERGSHQTWAVWRIRISRKRGKNKEMYEKGGFC